MLKLSQATTRSLVDLHGWSGVLLGLVLYVIVLTGTVAVFAEQLGAWSVGGEAADPLPAAMVGSESHRLQDLIDDLAAQVDPAYLEDIGLGSSPRGHLQLFFHTHQPGETGAIEEVGTEFEVNLQTGEVLQQRDGTGASLFYGEQFAALERFIVSVHTELHLPRPWGLLVTGILGLAMLIAAVTGFMMHRHLLRDIFTLRRNRSAVLEVKDSHTVAGSWTLPFAFILAFTGSFFSFAGSIGLPVMAMVSFGGDQETMIATVIGMPAAEDPTPANPASIDSILADGMQRTGQAPRFAALEHYGRADSQVTLFMPVDERTMQASTLVYNGASGAFVTEKPQVGLSASVGGALFGLMAPLHFGNFLGLVSQAIWFGLGFATCYVTLTGLLMWTERRRLATSSAVLERATIVVGYGLPVMLLASAYGYFFALGRADTSFWTPAAFCGAAALIALFGFVVRRPERAGRSLSFVTGALCLLLPFARLAGGGPGWAAALADEHLVIVTTDLILLASGAACVVLPMRRRSRAVAEPDSAHLVPGG